MARAANGSWLVAYRAMLAVNRLVRLDASGLEEGEATFQSRYLAYTDEVTALDVLANGQCLVGVIALLRGPQPHYFGDIYLVQTDGEFDFSFSPSGPLPTSPNVTLDSGRYVLWGKPGEGQGKSLVRLHSSGPADPSFAPHSSITSREVLALGRQSTGRFVVSLAATGSQNAQLLRLNSNGSSDGSFNIGSGFDGAVRALAVQSDDRIIVVGDFTRYRGEAAPRVVRLQSNGSRDTTFAPGAGFDRTPTKVGVLSDGTILFSGDFISYGGTPVSGLARVNDNGTLDTSFTINGSRTTLANVTSWAEGSDGTLLVFAPGYAAPDYDANGAGLLLLEPVVKPQITTQPFAQAVMAGTATTLSVAAESPETLSYQWQLDGVNIPGATGATYVLPSVQAFQAGQYSVVVSAGGFSVTSHAAALSVTAPTPAPSELVNLSTRAVCLTGDGVLVPGFVVGGTTSKRLLLRAVGPTLAQAPFNLAGVLSNPRLTLLRRNGAGPFEEIARNEDWETNSNVADILATSARLSAFALADPRESALLLDLAPGQYTLIADDGSGGTGTAIVEIYDADETNSSDARLINLSNRGFAGRGEQIMIPGFVVSAEGPKTVLIRVVGPTLGGAPFNVTTAMADPAMSVFRTEPGGGSTLLFRNDNWGDVPNATETAQVAEEVFAFPLAGGSRDAALVVTLEPGVYTVHGAAADGASSGVVLVEIYVVR